MVQSIHLSRAQLASLAGKTFSGNRDYYELFGWERNIQFREALARYIRQGIAKRVVDMPAIALWTSPPEITFTDSTDQAAWDSVVKTDIWAAFLQADILAGLGEFAVIYLNFDDVRSQEDLAKPVAPQATLLNAHAFDAGATSITKFVSEFWDPEYQLPELYTINPTQEDSRVQAAVSASRMSTNSFNIHKSRVVHVVDTYLTNKVFGIPRILPVWNDLDDLYKITGGTAETYWLTANRGIQVNLDKDVQLTADDEADLTDEITEYQHGTTRFMRTRGVEIKNLGTEVPNPKEPFEVTMSSISGTTGIPKRILIGSEAGQLASEQDRFNWAERINERRHSIGTPNFIVPFLKRLHDVGTISTTIPEKIEWPNAFQMTPMEASNTNANQARAAANYAKASTDNPAYIQDDQQITELVSPVKVKNNFT